MGKIKIKTIPFFLVPLIFVFIGRTFVLKNIVPLIQDYEKESIKFLMSFFYFLGLGIFFFCNGFSDFISKKLFLNKNELNQKIKSYYFYTLIMISFLNLISLTGFVGFLICGNFAWLVTFSIINFLSLFSYFPTEKRFNQKIQKFSS